MPGMGTWSTKRSVRFLWREDLRDIVLLGKPIELLKSRSVEHQPYYLACLLSEFPLFIGKLPNSTVSKRKKIGDEQAKGDKA